MYGRRSLDGRSPIQIRRLFRMSTPKPIFSNLYYGFTDFLFCFFGWKMAFLKAFKVFFSLRIRPFPLPFISSPIFSGIVDNSVFPFFQKFEIFNPVIKRITVYVMNNFIRIKSAPNMLLHNKSVFKNLSISILNESSPHVNPSGFVRFSPSDFRLSNLFLMFFRLFISFTWHFTNPFLNNYNIIFWINKNEVVS